MATFDLSSNPASSCYRLIDYDKAEVVPGIVNDTYFLIVSGTTPCMNMKAILTPVVYIDCPDFWDIELAGFLPGGICFEGIGNFTESILLTGITGSKGIRLVGATKSEKFDVLGGCDG